MRCNGPIRDVKNVPRRTTEVGASSRWSLTQNFDCFDFLQLLSFGKSGRSRNHDLLIVLSNNGTMESISSSSPSTSSAKASASMAEQPSHGHIHLQATCNRGIRHQNCAGANGTGMDTRDDVFARTIGDSTGRNRFMSENLSVRCSSPRQERPPAQFFVPAVNPTFHVTRDWHHPHATSWYPRGGYRPISRPLPLAHTYKGVHRGSSAFNRPNLSSGPVRFRGRAFAVTGPSQWSARAFYQEQSLAPFTSLPIGRERSSLSPSESHIVIPANVILPKEISPLSETNSLTDGSHGKRSGKRIESSPPSKRSKIGEALEVRFDKLDLLCAATLDLGPLQENPAGCSCPKSKCIALYCDCFKAGRRCNPDTCSCLNCKNTVEESGPDGARSKVSLSGCHATIGGHCLCYSA